MASNPNPNRERADSAIDGIDSVSKTLITAQNLRTAVSLFASDTAVQDFTELLELFPKREKDLEAREGTIRDLEKELAAQKKSHEVFIKQQVKAFADDRDDLIDENDRWESEAEEWKEKSEAKDTEIMALRKELEVSKESNADLEGALSQSTMRSKQKEQEILKLESGLDSALKGAENHKQALIESQRQMAELTGILEKEKTKNQELQGDVNTLSENYGKVKQFSAKMKQLDLAVTGNLIEALWTDAIQLVGRYFCQDLSQDILQIDWVELHENNILDRRIPLPQSNSEIAKKMRVAVILALFARLVDTVVFQPNYLLREETELRDILAEQATIDSTKETYTRGILLSMSTEVQDFNIKRGINILVDDLLKSVRVLLTSDALQTFGNALERLVTQLQYQWKTIQRARQKLETMGYSSSIEHPWRVFDVRVADAKEGKYTPTGVTTSNMEDDFIVIPRLYLLEAEAFPTPVTHGSVLRKSDLEAAEDECRKSIATGPFTRTTSNRHRNRPTRGVSGTSNTAYDGRNDTRFLSQARGASNS